MTDLRERFEGLEHVLVPDIWERVERTGALPPMTFPTPPSRRLAAGVVALVVVVLAAFLAVRAFRSPPVPASPIDAGSIVYVDRRPTGSSLHVIGATGSTTIASLGAGTPRPLLAEPAPSPDGVWIAATAVSEDQPTEQLGVVLLRSDGTGLPSRAMAPDVIGSGYAGAATGSPAWSPDGTRLAFDAVAEGLWVGDAFPNSERQAADSLVQVVGDPQTSGPFPLSAGEPAWIHEDYLVAAIDIDVGGPVPSQIYVVPSSGGMSDLEALGAPIAEVAGGAWDPAAHPGGALFAAATSTAIITFAGDGPVFEVDELAGGFDEVASPSWSPSGDRLVFAGRDGDDWDLYVVDLGGNLSQLTDTPDVDETDPSWGPTLVTDDPSPAITREPATEVARITDRIPAGQFPHQVLVGFGSAWVGAVTEEPGPTTRELLRIDPETTEVVARIPVRDLPGWEFGTAGTAVGQGSLWLAGYDSLQRIDPATNDVRVIPFDVGRSHADIWVDDEGGWVLSSDEGDGPMLVTRFDPSTGEILWSRPVPLRWGLAIVRSGDSLWAWGDGAESGPIAPDALIRLDAATGAVMEELTSQGPPAIAPDGRVWAGRDGVLGLLEPGGTFTPVTDTVTNTLGEFSPITDGMGGVWLLERPPGELRLTHVTGEGVVDRVVDAPRDAGGQSAAYDPVTDTFWFALFKDEAMRVAIGEGLTVGPAPPYDGGVTTTRTWRCRDMGLPLGTRTLVMGVLNVTPDSFSDGGAFADRDGAVAHAARSFDEGADIVDVGGESTRPGAEPVAVTDELSRVVPVIEGLHAARPEGVISVDTRRSEVALAAFDAGASIVNDVSAGRDPAMFDVAREAGAGMILMHMRGDPATMQDDPRYDDVVEEVHEYLRERVEAAIFAGLTQEQLAIDPGIGFGKDVEHNLALLRGVPIFGDLDAAVVVGASRKRFLGAITGVDDPADRLEGSLAVAVWCAVAGADVLRVHDVRETVRALRVADAIARDEP